MRFGEQISALLHSCLGPRGRPKLLSPSSVISSSSKRLVPLLHSSSPFARIVLRAAKTHLSSFEDGGLSCACLALWLASEPPPPPLPLAGRIYEHLAAQFLLILETEVAFDVDFGELHELMCVVRSLVFSKPACCLSVGDSEVVCSLVLRAFLEAVPSGVVGVAGAVLGQAPALSRVVRGVAVPLAEGDEERLRDTLSGGPFRACLFSGSLAGEVDWPAEVLAASKVAEVEAASLRQLTSVMEKAVEEGVRVFLCQKVIHPRLKKRLHSAKVVVVDRLGGESAARIRGILGESEEQLCHGTVSRGRVECLGRSRFLVLGSPDRTILLTHHSQEALAELEVVCRQSVSALFRLLVRPRVCFGGGCSEITAALLLANKVRGSLDAICSETNSTPGHLLRCLESFVRGVAHLCSSIHQGGLVNFVTDSESGHLWQQSANRCVCGSRDAASVTAWRQLVDLAGLGDILFQNVHPLSTSSASTSLPLLACSSSVTSVDNLLTAVPQNGFASFVPQTMQTSHLDASTSVPSTSLSRHKSINSFLSDSVRVSTGHRDILLDEFVCKRNSLSLAFETSSMLLKTTECIHTSPLAEQTKVFS